MIVEYVQNSSIYVHFTPVLGVGGLTGAADESGPGAGTKQRLGIVKVDTASGFPFHSHPCVDARRLNPSTAK